MVTHIKGSIDKSQAEIGSERYLYTLQYVRKRMSLFTKQPVKALPTQFSTNS